MYTILRGTRAGQQWKKGEIGLLLSFLTSRHVLGVSANTAIRKRKLKLQDYLSLRKGYKNIEFENY